MLFNNFRWLWGKNHQLKLFHDELTEYQNRSLTMIRACYFKFVLSLQYLCKSAACLKIEWTWSGVYIRNDGDQWYIALRVQKIKFESLIDEHHFNWNGYRLRSWWVIFYSTSTGLRRVKNRKFLLINKVHSGSILKFTCIVFSANYTCTPSFISK